MGDAVGAVITCPLMFFKILQSHMDHLICHRDYYKGSKIYKCFLVHDYGVVRCIHHFLLILGYDSAALSLHFLPFLSRCLDLKILSH